MNEETVILLPIIEKVAQTVECESRVHFALTSHIFATYSIRDKQVTLYICARCGVVFSPDIQQ